MSLTRSGIFGMLDHNGQTIYNATLQILDIKQLSQSRFRLVLSDGQYYIQSMLVSKYKSLVQNGILQKYTVIQLQKIAIATVNGKTVCVVIECDVVRQMNMMYGIPIVIPERSEFTESVSKVAQLNICN